MSKYLLIGGYSYSGAEELEFPTMERACEEWMDRWFSNGQRYVNGTLYPCWGDMEDDDYAVVNLDTEETRTRIDLLAERW